MMMDGWMFGWMWLWPVLLLTSLVVLVLGVVWLVRSQSPGAGSAAGSSARRILDERFARGEIDEEEYRRRREQLS